MEAWLLGLGWAVAASAAAFGLAGWDKARARRGQARVRERTLLLWGLVGGSPGLVLGMLVFRHKTRKTAFLAPLALVLALQAGLAWWWLRA